MRCICGPRRTGAVTSLVLGLTLAAGCATGAPAHRDIDAHAQEDDLLLQDALSRWERCVRRQSGPGAADMFRNAMRTAHALGSYPTMACEGHRRDVAQRFPAHLAPRVHATLAAREDEREVAARPMSAGTLIEAFDTMFADP